MKNLINETATIPQKDYMSFTEDEKKNFPVKCLWWKHEGSTGPIWVVFEAVEHNTFLNEMRNVSRNFKNGEKMDDEDDRYYAAWCPLSAAKKLAKEFNTTLEIG